MRSFHVIVLSAWSAAEEEGRDGGRPWRGGFSGKEREVPPKRRHQITVAFTDRINKQSPTPALHC